MSFETATTVGKKANKDIGFFNRQARELVLRQLSGLKRGQISLTDATGSATLGDSCDLHVNLQVHHPRFFRHAVLGGTLSVAESYLRGDWDCDNLTALFRIFIRNMDATERLDSGLSRVTRLGHRFYHWLHANSKSGSRKNIHAHYDLGNSFFQLWLDETMAYSSAYFLEPTATLQEASIEKFDRVCRKLDLQPSDHVLEIGSGWGGFAIHAVQRYGCRVTTTTISQEQYDLAKQRVEDAGVSDRVTILLSDYRDLTGQYDKLVSIEMIEAVGYRYFDTYFRKCGELLKPTGSFVIQAIVMPERDYGTYLRSTDFIQRYVFPGGCLASVGALLESAGRTTDFRFVHGENFAPHYAETLRRWRRTFHSRLDEVRKLNYPERFIRLWNYYLCYSEASFEERYTGVVQLQFDKPACRRVADGILDMVKSERTARLSLLQPTH
jgi:cyclopropane-fatty-acyl-phospholipid synthase